MTPAMTQSALTEEYLHKLDEEQEILTNYLVAGKCKTFDEYRNFVGQIKGIELSRRRLHDTIRMYMSAENIDA